MDQRYKDIIAAEFRNCVLNTIGRLDNAETHRPFHETLLSDDALFWSRFERSFSTSFGQRAMEEIPKVVARAGGASDSGRGKSTIVRLDKAIDAAITAHIKALRVRAFSNNWEDAVESISKVKLSGVFIEQRVISDLWWLKDGINHYMSIKTVKPNIDQTAVAKEDTLRLTFSDPSCKAYFGLYYNPYGEARTSYAHKQPMHIFNFHRDPVVLIGKDFWDTLGGEGCYETVLEIAKEVSAETRAQIKKIR